MISTDKVKQQESEKDVLLASNKSLADYNLSFEPKVNSGRQRLIELYQTASQLVSSIEEKERRLGEMGESVSLDTATACLDSAASQAEEESENLAEKFLDKTLDAETFIEEFMTIRKTAHLRRVKSDKMKELVVKHKNQSTPSRPAPVPPQFSSPVPPYPNQSSLPYPLFPPTQPSSLPYPLQPHSMFQPSQF